MNELALFDLLSPVLSSIDELMRDGLGLAPVWRIAVFAALGSAVSMLLFKKLSNQDELAAVKRQIKAVQKQLVGEQHNLKNVLLQNLSLTGKQLWLSFWPALLASVPIIFLLAFCSNQFGVEATKAGDRVYVTPVGLERSPADYRWQGVNAQWDARRNAWTFYQPDDGQTASLMLGGQQELSLPAAAAASTIHRRYWWNYLFANPAGYLDANTSIARFDINASPQPVLNWGPGWMRGWLFAFMVFLVLFSVAIKLAWKIE